MFQNTIFCDTPYKSVCIYAKGLSWHPKKYKKLQEFCCSLSDRPCAQQSHLRVFYLLLASAEMVRYRHSTQVSCCSIAFCIGIMRQSKIVESLICRKFSLYNRCAGGHSRICQIHPLRLSWQGSPL